MERFPAAGPKEAGIVARLDGGAEGDTTIQFLKTKKSGGNDVNT